MSVTPNIDQLRSQAFELPEKLKHPELHLNDKGFMVWLKSGFDPDLFDGTYEDFVAFKLAKDKDWLARECYNYFKKQLDYIEHIILVAEGRIPEFIEACQECHGTGRWFHNLPCRNCCATGLLSFRTPPEARAKAKKRRADKQEAKRATVQEKLANFKEQIP